MAAAGPAALDIILGLQGADAIVGQLRSTAGQFDDLRISVDATNDAVGQLRAQLTSGAAAGAFGGLAAQFRSIGLSAEQIPEIAHQFRERLFRDPIAIGAFGRSVVPARLGGPQDETRQLREAMRMLRETTKQEERLALARKLGLEVMLPLADADERHFRAMEEEGMRRGQMVDAELRQLRANHETQQQRTQDLQAERDMIQERIALRFGNWWRDNIALPVDEFMTRGLERVTRAVGLGPAEQAATSGAQSQRDALEQNTRALRILKDEIVNGGIRARTAVPGGLRGDALQKAIETHALQLGEFSLGAF